jgi:hypothetical protein
VKEAERVNKLVSAKVILQAALMLLALCIFVIVAFVPIHVTGTMTAQERELQAKKLQIEKQLVGYQLIEDPWVLLRGTKLTPEQVKEVYGDRQRASEIDKCFNRTIDGGLIKK